MSSFRFLRLHLHMDAYQLFLENLAQLEEDQTFYESELGGSELTGVQHEEIIKLGGIMAKRMRKFAEKGRTFADTLSPDFVNQLIDSIQTYQSLIMPPKVLGGMCPCLKPARSGPEYDSKMLTAKTRMVTSIFVVQAVLVENKGEEHNMESMHYADYVNKMNTVFNSLQEIKCSGNDKALEGARKKLLIAVEAVDRFVQHFGDSGNSGDFKPEAVRRIKATQELLSSRPTNEDGSFLPPNRRVLVKAQSSLQEIMNSAAAIALSQAKENLAALDKLVTLLKKIREQQTSTLQSIEDDIQNYNLGDLSSKCRENADIHYSDCNSKLRDATKRWTSIRNQSNPRKVAEYVEESAESNMTTLMKPLPGINPDIDAQAQRIFHDAGKKILTMGKVAEKFTKGAAGVVNTAASEITSGVKNVTSNAKNVVTTGGEKVKRVFTGEEAATTLAPRRGEGDVGRPRHGGGGGGKVSAVSPASAAKPKNPLDSIMGGGGGATAGDSTKKKDATKNRFLPMDAF
ncbi:hypothetical protein EON65_16695 [archaeon]|nr:MAG: hypothetical protein EON65_16695 [archaeon]